MTAEVELRVLDARLHEWGMPSYQSALAAAIDLHACVDAPVSIHPGAAPALISSGIAIHIADAGLAALVLPRSGLGHRRGLVLVSRAVAPLSPEDWQAVRLSLAVALRSVSLGLPLAIGVAWLLSRRRFFGRPLLDAFVHLPLVLPPVVTGYLLLLLFGVRGPLGGLLLHWFGVRLAFTTAGAALATAVMSFPLIVRAVRLSLDAVDPGLEAAARTLGAGALDRFATVTLPLILPGVLAGGVTAFAAGLGEFGAVITFASNIPGETQTIPLAIYSAIQVPGGEAAAGRLAAVSFTLAIAGLLLAEFLGRRMQVWLGR